jgi:hypothetical protein
LIRGEIKRGQFLIEIVQKDIAQEGRKRPALWNTFVGLLQPALYHHACPKVFSDQAKDAFVFDTPSNPAHQSVVVHRIEELLKSLSPRRRGSMSTAQAYPLWMSFTTF